MRQHISVTTAMLYSLEKIAEVNHRSLEEQILWYLQIALEIEWQESGAAILATLAQRDAHEEAYWHERPEEARRLRVRVEDKGHA